MSEWGFETRQIHAGQEPDPATGSRAVPIYQTTSYQFRDSEHAANLFALAEIGNIYTRIMNPTQGVLEGRLSALEGGVTTAVGLPGALVVSSGQAAETLALLNVAEAGDHIVASASLYGGTYNLLHYTFPKIGIEVSFVADPHDLDQWRSAVKPNTKAFFGEVLPNPKNDVLDIEGVSAVAHEVGVPLIVDNTVPSPYGINPLKWGADVVVHSTTKFIGGHGTSIGGVIIDGGTFDYGASGRHPGLTRTFRRSGTARTSSRRGCSCYATSARRSRRSTPSSPCRASRPSACAWSGTGPMRSGSPSSSWRIRRCVRSTTPVWSRRPGTSAPRSTSRGAGSVRCWPSRSTAGARPGSASPTHCNCTATSPTSAMCGRS